MDGESLDIRQNNIEVLSELFPNIFSERKIDLAKFKAALCEDIYFSNEHYTLNWAGKADTFSILQEHTSATLKFILVQLSELCEENSEDITEENLEQQMKLFIDPVKLKSKTKNILIP